VRVLSFLSTALLLEPAHLPTRHGVLGLGVLVRLILSDLVPRQPWGPEADAHLLDHLEGLQKMRESIYKYK
jgi:hypothetical protein